MLETFSYETFAAHVHSPFVVQHDDSPVELDLIEAKTSQAHDPARGTESFSLIFRGPEVTPLAQDNYHFSHRQLGEFMLFIVPIKHDAKGIQYQAIFNRLPAVV